METQTSAMLKAITPMREYCFNPVSCRDWAHIPTRPLLNIVRTGLSSSLDLKSALDSCLNLAIYMLFFGFQRQGLSLFTALIKHNPDLFDDHLFRSIHEHASTATNGTSQYENLSSPMELQQKRITTRLETCLVWKSELATVKSDAWRTSDDPFVIQACIANLTRPIEGQWPSAEADAEALRAIKKFMALNQAPGARRLPHTQVMDVAMNVETEEAVMILKSLMLDELDIGRTYEWMKELLYLKNDITKVSRVLPPTLHRFQAEVADTMCDELGISLSQVFERNRQLPPALPQVGWKALMERFAIAAYHIYEDEYENMDVEQWEDILAPPASEEEVRKFDGQLKGLLPNDVRDMLLQHDGYTNFILVNEYLG